MGKNSRGNTVAQGSQDFVLWTYHMCGTQQHLKKCVFQGTICQDQEGPSFLDTPPIHWSFLFPLALDSGRAWDCFDQWSMEEVM